MSRTATEMKFMLMMNIPAKATTAQGGIMTWPQEDVQAHIAFMHRFNQELKDSGELADAQGLDWPDSAKAVRAGKDGKPVTTARSPSRRSSSSATGSSTSTRRSARTKSPRRPRRRQARAACR
jgi:hypothetical protein